LGGTGDGAGTLAVDSEAMGVDVVLIDGDVLMTSGPRVIWVDS
jgi:hypothetical protein